MRILLVLLLLAVPCRHAAGAPKAALESFDVWRVPTPKGWTKRATKEFLNLSYDVGDEPSQLGLYPSRPAALDSIEKEIEKEWKDLVLSYATAGPRTDLKERRLACGAVARGTAADTRSKSGISSYTVLYVLAPYGRIVSVAVSSASATGYRQLHEKTIAAFLDGLELDVPGIARQIADATGGLWPSSGFPGKRGASSSGGAGPAGAGLGAAIRQYEFKADGTYTHRQELSGGPLRAEEWALREESGTYVLAGNRVTVTPRAGSSVVKNRAGTVIRTLKPVLQEVTYVWRFSDGPREVQLVLTPPGPTERDGPLSTVPAFHESYLLSGEHVPAWHVFAK